MQTLKNKDYVNLQKYLLFKTILKSILEHIEIYSHRSIYCTILEIRGFTSKSHF